MDEARVDFVFHEHVVERGVGLAAADGACEHDARGEAVVAGEDAGQLGARLVGGEGREKTETAAVDAEQGHLEACGLAGDAEHRAIAADHTAGVAAIEKTIGLGKRGRLDGLSAGGFGEVDELARDLGGAGFVGVDDEGESADGFHGGAQRSV
ncbi:MAG: hypothetical protein BWX86_02998 [Verrucomicrobia bacterium ADurb.Bin122]|nr:MAG: hypothetical protein BWX86_02998 [Verrucomicrobia bacterium ADurb.Bin122]